MVEVGIKSLKHCLSAYVRARGAHARRAAVGGDGPSERWDRVVVTNDVCTKDDQRLLTVAGALEPERIIGVQTSGCPHTAIREAASINLEVVEFIARRGLLTA